MDSMNFVNSANIKFLIGGIEQTIVSNEVSCAMAKEITAVKTQKYDLVNVGTIQKYTVKIKNINSILITIILFTDSIPVGMSYVNGSLKVNGIVETPIITGQVLTCTIASILPNETATIEFETVVN